MLKGKWKWTRAIAVSSALGLAAVSQAAEPGKAWPSFRGADRTGVAPDRGLLQTWPSEGPKLLWDAAGAGRGYASLAIAGGRIYTLGDGPSTGEDKDEFLIAMDQTNGKPVWQTKTGPAWNSGAPDWQGSRSTPTVDGDRVYVITPHGVLICCESATGKEVWRKDLAKEFEGKKGDGWGYSESVLIDGDHLICTPGGPKNTMVALNKKTGETKWTSSRAEDRGAGHASAVISQVGDTKVYVQTTASGAMGVRATDGKLLWTYDIDKTTAVIPTPIVRGDMVFFAAGYRRGGALLKQVPAGGGEVKVEEQYGIKPELANKHGGIVLVGEHLFGDSDDQGIPFCADMKTGKVVWKERGTGRGSASVAAADGCLYIHYTDGTMALVEANPDGFKEKGAFKVPGSGMRPSWSHPVILDGKLYLRENDRILCYSLKG